MGALGKRRFFILSKEVSLKGGLKAIIDRIRTEEELEEVVGFEHLHPNVIKQYVLPKQYKRKK